MKPIILSFIVALSSAGCAMQPITAAQATKVPSDRIYASDLLTPDGKRSVPVTVTRDIGFANVFGTVLLVNGRRVAKLGAGDGITIYLTPGAIAFGLESGAFNGEFSEVISAGQTQRFRITTIGQAGWRLSRTAYL